eukprot:TRINITY_DN7014_c0_g1_i2.p1 TRINITY_DN7014_c0_g1~~TRINITY_DN7014_c0_g1_i2.p1  ORF type:complete len:435 (-),score=60.49 TRINITY_DN7014_c0_g1_i2:830-2134(-)
MLCTGLRSGRLGRRLCPSPLHCNSLPRPFPKSLHKDTCDTYLGTTQEDTCDKYLDTPPSSRKPRLSGQARAGPRHGGGESGAGRVFHAGPSAQVLAWRGQRRAMGSLSQVLAERGFINDTTAHAHEAMQAPVKGPDPPAVYCGYDPTAPSLHVGNLATLLCLRHFRACGWQVIGLVGGATGRIGDPSGRSTERPLLSEAEIDSNAARIAQCVEHTLCASLPHEFGRNAVSRDTSVRLRDPVMVNNVEWYQGMGMLAFLRDIGKHVRVSSMLNKTAVKSRLGLTSKRAEGETEDPLEQPDRNASGEGMSYTEFSYQLLQAYDFVHLFRHHRCRMQVGGSDQWGNITAGISLLHSLEAESPQKHIEHAAHGLTIPLLMTASGQKIGKSAGNVAVRFILCFIFILLFLAEGVAPMRPRTIREPLKEPMFLLGPGPPG